MLIIENDMLLFIKFLEYTLGMIAFGKKYLK